MNLNANETNRRKCYNCEKKNHIAKRCKKSKLIQQLDTLEENLDEKDRKLFWKKKTRAQVLKENEQKNNFEKELRYEREYIFFTTRIYRSLHSMTSVIDTKTERINGRSALDQKNFILKFIKTRHFLKEKQSMCYFTSEKDSEYIHRKLKKYDKTSNVCESLEEFRNTNEIHEFYEKAIEMNEIQNFECNEHHWTGITRVMRICQKYEIESYYIYINNEGTIILYNKKSAINYISKDFKIRLRAFNETDVVEQNDEKIIIIFECNRPDMIFRRKRDSADYLMILTTYLIKSSLKILKEDNNLKDKELGSYISIRSTHIIKITLCKRKVITIIHRKHKGNYIIRNLWKDIFSKEIFHFNEIIKLTSLNEFNWKETVMIKESLRKYVVIIITATHKTEFRYHSITIAFLTYFNYWRKQVLWKSKIIE